ncbi:MAG TPA: glycoside hydrolase family 76 protein [Gaiellaceae bacterium]|nr:glycoside hydrolase family 76 protein [Gaiellaceae bacterium]
MGRILALVAASIVLPLPSHATLVANQAQYQQFAEQGLARMQQGWWNAKRGWYDNRSPDDGQVASVWSSYPMMELVAAVAIADPTPANVDLVNTTFKAAEGFWDPTINGTGGIAWQWGLSPSGNAYFDDAGWWGIAYLDAYRATGKTRWLWDAGRVLAYIDRYGWDSKNGGIWWDTGANYKTSEPLAAATLIAATLYRVQHKAYYLKLATKYLAWADAKTLNPQQGNLYGRNATDGTTMDYVEGMMIAAHVQLCLATKQQAYCNRAESLAQASLNTFPTLHPWVPEADTIYLEGILALYAYDGNPTWYALAYENAEAAKDDARDDTGWWSKDWWGDWADPGVLFTPAATLELFAWMAATPPPAS